MVNFSKLGGVGYQGGLDIAALQAAQSYYGNQVERDVAKQALLRQGLATGGEMLDNYLTRKNARDQKKQDQEALQQYYDAQLEVALGNELLDPNAGYTQAPLELSSQLLPEVEAQQSVKQTGDNKFDIVARNDAPPVNPTIDRLRRMTKAAAAAGISPSEIQQSYALTELTPTGVKDKYTAMNTKSEYQALEDKPGVGTSRRTLGKDLELEQTRAQIAASNRGGKGGDGAKNLDKQGQIVQSYLQLQTLADKKLADILESAPDVMSRGWGAALSKIRSDDPLGAKIRSYQSLLKELAQLKAKAATPGAGAPSDFDTKSRLQAFPNPLDDTNTLLEKANDTASFAQILADQYGLNYASPDWGSAIELTSPRLKRAQQANSSAPTNNNTRSTTRQNDTDLIRGY
jgi:hypothetical protein